MRIFPCGRFSFFVLRCTFVVSRFLPVRYTERNRRDVL
nr:MAG TPA: hypothetical protein [Caudoviricetes sp.]DAV13763.1 MAG TPA: hypothetical protein [Caudoviricetes sp.]